MAEAEAWGASNGWTIDRHIAFPTVDVPIANLPKLQRLWKESLFARIEHAQREALGLAGAAGGAVGGAAGGDELSEVISEVISDLDVFVVK